MNKKQRLNCIHFIYNCIYADYKKALRKRQSDGIYDIRKQMYVKYLRQFQEIINKDLKLNIEFLDL